MVRPYLERLPTADDASWSMLNRRLDEAIPFQWHHHPEYELTLTLNSEGQRFIGDHVGEYGDADLVLVGPNLPHTWSSRQKIKDGQPHVALVFWFRQAWIDSFVGSVVELKIVERLFRRAAAGLSFPADVGKAMRDRFEAVFALGASQRLVQVLGILLDLAGQVDVETLATAAPLMTTDSRSRLDRVLHHLHRHYQGPIRMDELAQLAALSESGLHRLFAKHTRATVFEYLTRLRVGDACARLSATDLPIAHIASEVGYNNLANFNRQFRSLRAMTPRQYRASFRN